MRTIPLLILAFLFQSCGLLQQVLPKPDEFSLNQSTRQTVVIAAMNMSHIDSVEEKGDNSLLIHGSTTVAMATDFYTNFTGDFTVNIQKGTGVKFSYRTTSNNFKSTTGISFNYTVSGSWIEENGQVIAKFDTVNAVVGETERIQIINLGKQYSVQVGCNVIYRGTTSLPATEYILAGTFPESHVLLTGMDFIPIRRADDRNTPEKRAERVRW
ncbi:MAG: hypothetical protein HYZ54_01020 [Ignavibacteriae bacterium]|nr:hypothetical protein [Ignavibacteriota bacterium]